jgi:DNA polymerase I-like protein with 3'-5' exonuclease and polymerase domains
MFGRVRHLPDATIVPRSREDSNKMEAALRRAVNSPIQADASDLTVWSLGRIWTYLNAFNHADPTKPSRLRGSVHDSILLSVHAEDAAEILGHIKYEILENPCIDFIEAKGVALRADVSVGPNWGDQTDISFE